MWAAVMRLKTRSQCVSSGCSLGRARLQWGPLVPDQTTWSTSNLEILHTDTIKHKYQSRLSVSRARISQHSNKFTFLSKLLSVEQVECGVAFSHTAGFFGQKNGKKCALSLLPVPSHWLQKGVPGHTSVMDTAQRSQAPSQIAGLPHFIRCSNYTISCHYSCCLDPSSRPSREGWGWAEGAGVEEKRKGCSIQGSGTWGCKMEQFWRGNSSGSSLCPASHGRGFTNLLPPSVPV